MATCKPSEHESFSLIMAGEIGAYRDLPRLNSDDLQVKLPSCWGVNDDGTNQLAAELSNTEHTAEFLIACERRANGNLQRVLYYYHTSIGKLEVVPPGDMPRVTRFYF